MSETTAARKIKMLAETEIKDSMADMRFYEVLPEFLPLRAKMRAAHDDVVRPKGCAPCAKHRAYRNFSADYLRIVQQLRDDGKARMRQYFGADELRATVLDPATQQPRTIKI